MRITSAIGVVAAVLAVAGRAWAVDKPPVAWVASPNFTNASRTAANIDSVVIHTVEGTYAGAISWFQNPSSQVSAHYVISPTGQITQMVEDEDIAWHATYYNSRAIGIECAGYAGRADTWTPELTQSLYQLVAWLCQTYDLAVVHPTTTAYDYQNNTFNGYGLLSHAQIQPWNRTDPGPYFDWDGLVANVNALLYGSPPPPPETWPDLVVTAVWPDSPSANVGATVTFSATVQNVGAAEVPAGQVIPIDFDVNGTYVATGLLYGPIPAGTSVDVGTAGGSWTVTLPGTYAVGALVDPNNDLVESDESNNTGSTSTTSLGAYRITALKPYVRSSPSSSGSKLGTVTKNEIYAAMAYSGGWYRIWYRGGTGWVYGGSVANVQGVAGIQVNTSTLNVRSGPSTSYKVVGTASSGQVYIQKAVYSGWTGIYYDGITTKRCVYTAYTLPVEF